MKNKNLYVAIMAGGVGSRFWPSSRENYPKQFLDILGVGKSLIQLTYERFEKLVPAENIIILTNKSYVSLVKDHLPHIRHENIIPEPSRNNTAPCNALLALKIQQLNPKATLIIAPSDHVILKENLFIENIEKAVSFANQNGALVTLGIEPTRPDTGYGYIEMGDEGSELRKVNNFREKPNVEMAKQYLDQGNFVWNAGIFIWTAAAIIDAFKMHCSQVISTLSRDLQKLNTIEEQTYIDEVYPLTDSISIDYAILEKADNVYTIPSDIGWSDLGTWGSLHEYLPKDDFKNVVLAKSTKLDQVKNTLIKGGDEKLIVIKGLDNYIIIDEKDILMIYPKEDEQEIKALRKSIKDDKYL